LNLRGPHSKSNTSKPKGKKTGKSKRWRGGENGSQEDDFLTSNEKGKIGWFPKHKWCYEKKSSSPSIREIIADLKEPPVGVRMKNGDGKFEFVVTQKKTDRAKVWFEFMRRPEENSRSSAVE